MKFILIRVFRNKYPIFTLYFCTNFISIGYYVKVNNFIVFSFDKFNSRTIRLKKSNIYKMETLVRIKIFL